MSELSNALRQRLASGEAPRVHPDADTLTAYMEQLLSAPERANVVEHLAGCRQCRDVLALSLPQPTQVEALSVAVALPARRWRAWRSWGPVWGLAVSLAGLAIVTAVIIELPRRQMPKQAGLPAPVPVSSAAKNTPGSAPAPGQSESPAVQPPATPSRASSRGAETVAGLSSAKRQSVSPVETAETMTMFAAPKAANRGAAAPYVNVQMFSNDAIAPVVDLPSAPAPQALGDREQNVVIMLGGTTQLTARADAPHQAQSGKPLRIFTPPASSSHFFGLSMVTTVGREAKQFFQRPAPAIRGNAFSTSAMGGPGQFNPAKELGASSEVAAAPPLAVRNAAELDQSHAFTARALADSSASKMEAAAVEDRARKPAGVHQSAWKVEDGKLLKLSDSGAWTEASGSDGIEFSVVSSHGLDIWAGGSNAAVIHSRDDGATWERITLGASATGTITRIEAGGSKVMVRSSSGQSWSSPDGGKTWAFQD